MLFIELFKLGIVAVIVFIIIISRRSSGSKNENISAQDKSYDYGYWEGRRSLRQEVIDFIENKDSVQAEEILEIIDANQWLPEETSAQVTLNESYSPISKYQSSEVDVASKIQPMDYSIGLLYLGAFLFIAAASLFVLLSGVDGWLKTVVVVAVSAIFYILGLKLSKRSQRLSSVGSTFAAIGLMLAPLTGVAVYGYWLNQSYGGAVWLFTSLACLALYVHALFSLRKDYVGYLCIAMLISLVESATFQIGLGMYFLAWGLILVSIISAALHKYIQSSTDEVLGKHLSLPLQITTVVIVPFALLWSLVLVLDHGVEQLIFSLFFASAYYLVYGYWLRSGVFRQTCWIAAQCLALISGGLFVYHATHAHEALSVYLAACSIVYIFGSLDKQLKQVYPLHHAGVFAISILTIIATIFSVIIWPTWLVVALSTSLVVFWLQWRANKRVETITLSLIVALVLPAVIGWYALSPGLSAGYVASFYVVLAYGLMTVAYYLKGITDRVRGNFILSYLIAIIFAFCVSCFSGHITASLVMVCAAVITYIAAKHHRQPELSYVGHALLYISLAVISYKFPETQVAILSFGWLALSAALYMASFLTDQVRWRDAARISSSAGLILTSYVSLVEDIYWYIAPISLIILALICAYEASEKKKYSFNELAAAVALVAVQVVFYKLELKELLVYTHMWALLFITFAVGRYGRNEDEQSNSYIMLGLAASTIPFALLLLAGNVGIGYSWLFIAQHIFIVIVGVLLKRSNVLWWGLVSTILAVLYQLRDLQYLALGILSVFVLSVAVWLALRHQK